MPLVNINLSNPLQIVKMSIPGKKTEINTKFEGSIPVPSPDVENGSITYVSEAPNDGDEALRFLKSQHAVHELTPEDEKRLLRKIDWMIMPLMWACYCLQYLDKTLGNFTVRYRQSYLTGRSKLCRRNGSS